MAWTQADIDRVNAKRGESLPSHLPPTRGKYRNVKTEIAGVVFDSKKEAQRWIELQQMERAGLILDLERQPEYALVINGVHVCDYRGDFRYQRAARVTVEDCKGMKTPVYRLKKKLMKACYGIDVLET